MESRRKKTRKRKRKGKEETGNSMREGKGRMVKGEAGKATRRRGGKGKW